MNAAPKTTVLFIDTTPFFGPLMQVHTRIMKHLDRARFRVVLAAAGAGEYGAAVAEVPDLTVVRYRLKEGRRGKGVTTAPARLLQAAERLATFVRIGWSARKQRVGIVHVGMTQRMLIAGIIVSRISGARLVVHVHADPLKAGWKRRTIYRLGMRWADAVITVSSFVKGRVVQLGVPESRVWTALNTVDLDRFNPRNDGSAVRREYEIPDDAPLVLCLGRLLPWKGQHHLARSLVRVRQEAVGARALIIGWEGPARSPAGSYGDQVRSIIHDAGMERSVIVAPARPDAPALMAAADIVAAPSTDEPAGLTVLEAMASGKPVVGFNSGGIPEELGRESVGLVDVGDEVALANALLDLVSDPSLRRRQGERNRHRAEEGFYEARLAEDVTVIYDKILGDTAPVHGAAKHQHRYEVKSGK